MSGFDFQERLPNALRELVTAVNNARYYGFGHPNVGEYVRAAQKEIAELLVPVPSVTLFLVGDRLVVDGRSFPSDAPFLGRFANILKDKGIERLSFHRGVTAAELADFVARLARKGREPVRSSPGIRLGKVEFRESDGPVPAESPPSTAGTFELAGSLASLGDAELDRIRDLYEMAEHRKRLDIRGLGQIIERFIGLLLADINPISLLASVKGSHEYTFTHAVNVGILTIVQAKNFGFSGRVLRGIGFASMLHDVGKIFIPNEILNKPGGLTAAERTVIETHTIKGGRYLMDQEGIATIAVLTAFEHHLRFDGTGYPAVSSDWRPHLISQMVAISDVFDAMRSNRSYSRPKSQDEILGILAGDGGAAFNPRLLDNFLSFIARTDRSTSEPIAL